jgi:hypothetical protein
MLRACAVVFLSLAGLAACSSQVLRDNQQGWRRAECDQILDTHTRERCLKEIEASR